VSEVAERRPLPGRKAPPSALVLAFATAVQTLAAMATLLVPAIAPQIARVTGVPAGLVGLQTTLIFAVAMVISPVAGRLVRRLGACRVSQWALALMGAFALLAMVPHPAALAGASVLLGIAYALPNPSAAQLLSRFTPPRHRNLLFSIKQTGVPLGGVLAGLLAPALALHAAWWLPFFVLLALAGLLALAAVPWRERLDGDRQPDVPIAGRGLYGGLRLAWNLVPLRLLAVTALCLTGLQLCLMTYLVVMLVGEFGFDPVLAGAVLAGMQASGVVGRIFWGFVADRSGNGRIVLIGLALLIVALVVVAMQIGPQTPPALIVGLFLLLGGTAVGWNGVYMGELVRLAPAGSASDATAGALFFTFMGVLVGPALFALLQGLAGSVQAMLPLLIVLGLCAAFLMWRAGRH